MASTITDFSSQDSYINELFLAMNLVGLERLNDRSFSFLNVFPKWFITLYPELDRRQPFFPISQFPGLGDFLLDANDWWMQPSSVAPKPVFCEKADASGTIYLLKISAIQIRRRQLLVIEHQERLMPEPSEPSPDLGKKLKDTEQALEQERFEKKELSKKFRILEKAIETMPLGVTITDTARKIFYTNPADAATHGYEVEELLEQDVSLFAPPEFRRQMTLEDISTMKGWVRESVNVRKDGTKFPAQLMSELVKDDDGAPLAIITTCENITERKRAEKALSEERNLLRALIDNIPDLIYVKDRKGRFLLNNQAYTVFVGLTNPQTLHEKTVHGLFPEEIARQDEQYDRQVMQSGFSMIEHEEILPAQDQAEHVFLTTRVPLHNERGAITALVGICHDITKRRQSEKQIDHLNAVLNAIRIVNQLIVRERDRKQLIQTACNHLVKTRGYANAWIALVNEENRVNFIAQSGLGEKFSKLVKYLRQGKIPPCLQEAIHNQSIHPLMQYSFKEQGACCLGNWCLETPKIAVKLAYAGKTYGALFVGLPPEISANQEECTLLEEIAGDMGFALYNIEVEEQRQAAEKTAEKNQQWLVATLRNLSEAVVTTNEHGAVTFFNPVAEALTGWKQEELLGKDMTFRITAGDSEIDEEHESRPDQQTQPEITILLGDYSVLIAKDGKKIPVEYSGSPIMNEQGQFTGFVMIFKDITERKQAEDALEKSLSLLRSTLESTADGILALNIENGETTPIFNQKFIDLWQIPEHLMNEANTDQIAVLIRQQLKEPERFPDILQALQTPGELLKEDCFELLNGKAVEMFSQPRWMGEKCVGAVLSFHDVTEQKRAEHALRYRMTFGNLINTISTYFINLTVENIDHGIQRALQTIGEFTGVDHGYVALTPEYGRATAATVTHEWWSPHSLGHISIAQTLDSPFFSWAKERIEHDGLLNIPSVKELGNELRTEETREFLRDSQSMIMIPLVFSGKLIGVLSFESLHSSRTWPDDIIALLRILAEMLTGAFERKRAGETLEQERKRLFAVLENLPAYIFLRDPRGAIRFANYSFRKRFGDPESPQTQVLLDQREGLWEDSQAYQVFATKTPQGWEWYHAANNAYYQAYDYPFTDSDGSALIMEFGIEITDRKLMEMALEVERASLAEKVETRTTELSQMNALLHQEVLERKQAQIELEQAKEAAESASRAKSEFLANMSHELRTPLNAILGYAQILKNATNLNERQTDGLDIIKNSGTHLLNLINEILDLSKIEAGFMELVFTDVHLPEFLKQIAEMIAIRAKQKGIDFVYECDPRLAPGVRTDEKRLRQILINLLGNAVKFTERGSVSLRIRVCEAQECARENETAPPHLTQVVRFEIADTGIGIAQEDLDEIFLPFQQVGIKRHTVEGTGLGLTISQKFVRLMGSRLVVHSMLGEGTTFHFDLALDVLPDFLPTVKPAYRKVLGYKGRRRTLLVVDDRKENRMLLADMLVPLGFHILEAEDGIQCLEQLRTHRPDATLLDLRMPVMNGVETMEHIRNDEELKEHVIFAVSASVYEDDRSRSLQAGCQAFLMKPIYLEDLLEQLRVHLGLEWLYGESAKETGPTAEAAAPFTAAIERLPQQECEILLKLATTGRVRPLLQHLDTLDPAYHVIIEELRQYAKTFQLQAIIEKLKMMESEP